MGALQKIALGRERALFTWRSGSALWEGLEQERNCSPHSLLHLSRSRVPCRLIPGTETAGVSGGVEGRFHSRSNLRDTKWWGVWRAASTEPSCEPWHRRLGHGWIATGQRSCEGSLGKLLGGCRSARECSPGLAEEAKIEVVWSCLSATLISLLRCAARTFTHESAPGNRVISSTRRQGFSHDMFPDGGCSPTLWK